MRTPLNRAADAESRPSTPSHLYSEDYFLAACEGYEGFEQEVEAAVVSPRLVASSNLVKCKPGERVLDIGCGRGEIVLSCAHSGAAVCGVDYSADALRIARRGVTEGDSSSGRISLGRADAKRLPFADASFDKLLMFDLVEHLYPWELAQALSEAWRVLGVHGQLLIHTAPNRWYYRFGYPLYRLFERLRGRELPADPRSRFPFHYLHVNEQDVLGLRRSLRRAGFDAKVWLDNVRPPLKDESSPALKLLLTVLLDVYPFRWIFRNDLFAVACKRA